MAVSQSIARPLRTGLQLISAGVLVEVVDSTVWDMTDRQYAAIVALLTMVIGFIQVMIEDKTGTALLRVPNGPAVATVESNTGAAPPPPV